MLLGLSLGVQADEAALARQLLQQGQAAQAAQAYGALIERSPGDPDHWLGRGLAHARQSMWSAATADLEQAVTLAPGYADAWSALADVYRWTDRPAAAADAYARLAALRPQLAQVQVLRALSLWRAGDAQGAHLAAQRARELGASQADLSELSPAPQPAVQTAEPQALSSAYRWAGSLGFSRTGGDVPHGQADSQSLRHYAAWGSIALERLAIRRFGTQDVAWAVDAYPRLWTGGYANLRYQKAPSPDLYPGTSWRAELYQNVGGGWELAASRDHLGFGSGVRIDGVSAGKYWGNFFARWRHQQVRSDTSSGQGDRVFVRYYYEGDADHYLELNLSRGRSDDFGSALLRSSRSDSRGLVWYHFVNADWGFKLSASRSRDGSAAGVHATDVGLSLARRW